MASIIGCRVWYGDGSVATSWEGSPATGVQVVAWLDDDQGVTWSWGIDGAYTYPGSPHTKTGSTIKTAAFNRILKESHATIAALGYGAF